METSAVTRKTNHIVDIGIAGLDKETSVSVKAMPIWQLILVRVIRMYLQTFLGLLTLDGLGVIQMSGFMEHWSAIGAAMTAALAPTFVSFAQNLLEFLTKIDIKNPSWRA